MNSKKFQETVVNYVVKHIVIKYSDKDGRNGYDALFPILRKKIGILRYTEANNAFQLYSFQVDEKYQQRGIGRKLLAHVVNLALEEGISQIYVAPAPCTDLKTSKHYCTTDMLVKIYEKYGFEKQHDAEPTTGPKFYFLDLKKFSHF